MDKFSVIQCKSRDRYDRNLRKIEAGAESAPFAFSSEACGAAAKCADLYNSAFEVWRISPDKEAQIAVYAPASIADEVAR